MNNGVDAWYWAEQYCYMEWGTENRHYFLRNALVMYEREQTVYWTTVVDEMNSHSSMLQEVPFRDMISFLAK
jgi:hypothetical protein